MSERGDALKKVLANSTFGGLYYGGITTDDERFRYMAVDACKDICEHLGLSWEIVDEVGDIHVHSSYLSDIQRVEALCTKAADAIATLLEAAGIEP